MAPIYPLPGAFVFPGYELRVPSLDIPRPQWILPARRCAMVRRVDLIDQFTDLVVGADDPRRLAERTLEVVMSLLNGRSGAVFTCEGAPTLFASRGIDQAVLEVVP